MRTEKLTTRSYAAEWTAALERTARFGLQVAPASPAGRGPYLTEARLPEIFPVLREALGKPVSTDALVGQCLQVTWDFLPTVERWLGCQAFFTIGWVELGRSRQWDQFDDAFISTMLTRGHGGGPVKVQAWLTLDSLEILDVTRAIWSLVRSPLITAPSSLQSK